MNLMIRMKLYEQRKIIKQRTKERSRLKQKVYD